MQEFFTTLFYFLSPIFGMEAGVRVFGVDLLDLVSLSLLTAFILLWLGAALQGRSRPLSGIDLAIFAFCGWCLAASIVYLDQSRASEVAKFIFPPLTYVLFKSMIKDRDHFVRCMRWMLVAFLVPTLWSAALVLHGQGLDKVNYWTGLARYQGVYVNPHNFGHTMTFMLMLSVIYVWFKYTAPGRDSKWLNLTDKLLLAVICLVGVFDLYESYVRTAWTGFLIFLLVFAYKYSKKLVIAFVVSAVLVGYVAEPLLKLVFHDVVEVQEGKRDAERIGSGRPYIWGHNLDIFKNLSFDRQLAGVGVGNRGQIFVSEAGSDNVWNSHNDFLEVMMQVGIVGLLLFLAMQWLIYRRIAALPLLDRLPFLALFLAVVYMNFMSNSYVVRFSIGQMLYMLLAYIESAAMYAPKTMEKDSSRTIPSNGAHRRLLNVRK
ncbi:MAG TPA: O-antigen ligase family protein [Gammaproteobacteria bacterium]